jgi:hypothetical protein
MRIEIKNHQDESGQTYRAIFADEQLFDWWLDEDNLTVARQLCKREPLMKKSVMGDIQSHFVQCFSEFIGREITLKEINEALVSGSS